MERARDRRRGHREHVDRGPPLLQLFLLRHAEALLFVHDEESEIAEREILRQHAVRRDQDVDAPLRDLRHDLLLLDARPEAGEELDRDRKRRETPAEGPEVLVGQHRRRREHRHLLSVEHGFEGRAHRDLRLAVPDVAAEEPVHRLVRLHVALDVRDRLRLIRGLRVLEGVLELFLPRRVLRKREALRDAAPRVQLQELVRHVAHRAPDGRLAAAPSGAAQTVEHRRHAFDSRVLLHEIESLDGEEQGLVVRVADVHELALRPFDRHALQALEEADAVVAVHDGVPELQVAEIGQKRLGGPLAPRHGGPLLAEDLGLGVNRDARRPQPEAGGDLRRRDAQRAGLAWRRDRDLVLAREPAHLLFASGRPRRDENLLARLERSRDLGGGLLRAAGVSRDLLGREAQRLALGDAEAVEAEEDSRNRLANAARRMEELLGSEDVAVRIAVGGDALGVRRDGLLDRGRLEHGEKRVSRVREPGGGHRGGGGSEDDALRLRGRPSEAILEERPFLSRFPRRRECRHVDRLQTLARPLRVGVEDADRRDPVAVELDAKRQLPVRRKDVEEPAAHREIARLDDQISAAVAELGQPRRQARERDVLPAFREGDGQAREVRRRRQAREERRRGQDRDERRRRLGERREEAKLVAPRLERRRDPLVRRQLRGRRTEDRSRAAGREVLREPLGLLLVGHDDGQAPAEVRREGREQQSRQRADGAGDRRTDLSPSDPLTKVLVRGQRPNGLGEKLQFRPTPPDLPPAAETSSRTGSRIREGCSAS